ncbi:TetR/AcrR family transcriptional regulator [Micromonospora sp. WMMD1120]|uniref:TetR/AcrR family transcriptional regulator n=1 Tax=Micromonospora sp. WMMD1120 TaxID=3016106 RepID=UPI002417D0CE|nr:TetR/AcrR family transcriptional regulator [Micromonospora sp. WMMD1120]MDG4809427.1 TetR/AcrR family transcriptional regulator [Micromonospora sp. WMMD1120]
MGITESGLPRHTALRAVEVSLRDDREDNAAPEILEAAVRAFDEAGYEQASIKHIAELAGTSKSLVTYYFPTKQTLASAVMDLAYPGGVFMGTRRRVDDPLDAILWVAEHVTTNVLYSPLARAAIKLGEQFSGHKGFSGRLSGWHARLTDYLEEARLKHLISPVTDPTVEARFLLCGIVGLVSVAMETGSRLSLIDDAVQITRDRLAVLRVPRDLRTNEGAAVSRVAG